MKEINARLPIDLNKAGGVSHHVILYESAISLLKSIKSEQIFKYHKLSQLQMLVTDVPCSAKINKAILIYFPIAVI